MAAVAGFESEGWAPMSTWGCLSRAERRNVATAPFRALGLILLGAQIQKHPDRGAFEFETMLGLLLGM
jgi:hypothetical protein